MENLKRDCRHVRWDRPCTPHKLRGKVCGTCDEYSPVLRSVLIVKLAATGDVLRTTAFLPAIHATWPQARVTWLTAPAAAGLFAGNDLVDEVLTTDDASAIARLLGEQYDAVLCPDADPDAAALAAIAAAAERRGFVRSASGQVTALSPAAERWLMMGLDDAAKKANRRTYQALVAEALGLEPAMVREPILVPSTADQAAAQRFRARLGFRGPLIGLNTGAGGRWEYKQWTLANQRAFLQQMTAAGCGVLLLGGPEEVERHRELLAAGAGRPVFDAGTDNPFGLFAALLELCAAVVTGDTLAVHVAAARKVPAVVLFGPTSLHEVELYGRGTKIAPQQLECLCCYLPKCDRSPYCQELIEPATVWAAVQQCLSAPATR
jgi:heptosyltransferase-2